MSWVRSCFRLVALCAGTLWPWPIVAADGCDPWAARVESTQGAVEARHPDAGGWSRVGLNDTLCPGDTLRLGGLSRAALRLPDDTVVRLDQQSTVTFVRRQDPATSLVDVLQGVLHFISRIPRALQLKTPFVNAAVEGTEFLVRVEPATATITVFGGRVRASNPYGQLVLEDGQSAIARAGAPPTPYLVVRPRDTVQWALYYPPVLDSDSARRTASRAVAMAIDTAWASLAVSDVQAAIARLNAVETTLRDGAFYTYRAALLLYVGRAMEAAGDLRTALALEPDAANALALQAIVALAQNDPDAALGLAQRAIASEPDAAAPLIALSYAHQGRLNLDPALEAARRAVELDATNALAWARVAELELARGALNPALDAAHTAVRLQPRLSRTQTILGFAHLARIDPAAAQATFEDAVVLDQSDPLPRLGLGVAKIRRGNLVAGRRDMEVAAILDPNNALVRSYLGKAFYEELRDATADNELAVAKALDPLDPTPFFYDAILEQAGNRPVEALEELTRSIELNDNRAPFRSPETLVTDEAERGASIARIYTDLGFQQRALVEGWRASQAAPGAYAAHRFLADTYSVLPRHEIARVSELLQSQLLQPLNVNPVQPQLAVSGLGILDGAGPSTPGLYELNPFFTRNGFAFQADGVIGNADTLGEDLVLAGLFGPLSFSVGQFHYETSGVRENNDQKVDIYDVFAQSSLSPQTSVQLEYRNGSTKTGDLRLRFELDDFDPTRRYRETTELYRAGFLHRFSPTSRMLGSVIFQELDSTNSSSFIEETRLDEGGMGELQHQLQWQHGSLITGAGYFEGDTQRDIQLALDASVCPLIGLQCRFTEEADLQHANAYGYATFEPLKDLALTAGLSVDRFDNIIDDGTVVNPKVGVLWNALPGGTLRMAAFRSQNRELVADQTLEPTHVAGFNQFFDDSLGTKAWRYGIAWDQGLISGILLGGELSRRDLDVAALVPGTDTPRSVDWQEWLGRGYVYWTPTNRLAFSVEYQYEDFEADERLVTPENVLQLETHRLPLGVRWFHPSGLSLALGATFIHQEGVFFDPSVPPQGVASRAEDDFWVVDAGIRYRLPQRRGMVSLELQNALDADFHFLDTDPANPTIARQLLVFGKVNLSF